MFPIGLSTCGKTIDAALFASYAASGITHVEISAPTQECVALDMRAIARMAQEAGLTLWSYHLPFSEEIDISLADSSLRNRALALHIALLRDAASVGIRNFIIHPSSEPIADGDRAARMDTALESLRLLANAAREAGATLAVENLPRTCLGRTAQDMLTLLGADAALRMCFDTNHLLMEKTQPFLSTLLDKVITLHVSDYDFTNEKHWLPGEGKNDWPALLAQLKQGGYTGPWLYEVGFGPSWGLTRSRLLTCADVARNARQLFAGETPDVVPPARQ